MGGEKGGNRKRTISQKGYQEAMFLRVTGAEEVAGVDWR